LIARSDDALFFDRVRACAFSVADLGRDRAEEF
jgi:hypothetical protein